MMITLQNQEHTKWAKPTQNQPKLFRADNKLHNCGCIRVAWFW